MQQLTESMKKAIRSTYQVPITKLEIYNQDGSLAGTIEDVQSLSINVAKSRKVLRTFAARLNNDDGKYSPDPFLYADNFLWYNKTCKIFYGFKTGEDHDVEEFLPQGVFTIDSIKPSVGVDGSDLEISGQDLSSRLIDDKFDDIYKVKDDLSTGSANYALSGSASGSSAVTGYEPGKAIDGDVYQTYWQPDPSDAAPQITVDLGSARDLNVVYLYWGRDAFDYDNRVRYFLESSSDGSTWSRITDLNGYDENVTLFGYMEHCFDQINARYIRINVVSWTGEIRLRHIKPQLVNAVETVDKVVGDILMAAGFTEYNLPVTRQWVKEAQADIGEEKQKFINKMASSAGWVDLYFDEQGIPTTHQRVLDPDSPAWDFTVETDNIFSFSPRFTNDVYNVIVAIYKSSTEKAIVGKAIDDDPSSPTSVQVLGRRVRSYENSYINTQDKADQFAAQKLFERTRYRHQTSLPITGHPAIQFDDVVLVTVKEAKIDKIPYYVTGFVTDFDADTNIFDTRINISQL